MIYFKKLRCWLRRHKTGKIQHRVWDMVGNPLTDCWSQYKCESCGIVKDFSTG